MKKFRSACWRYFFCAILAVCSLQTAWAGPLGVYQHGTVVRMRMSGCLPSHRGFTFALAGSNALMTADVCPEYTLVSDKVVFVIIGRSPEQFVPLADVIDFRVHNNQMAVRVDDARHESKFNIKEMILRSEWDLVQKHITNELSIPSLPDSSVAMRGQN